MRRRHRRSVRIVSSALLLLGCSGSVGPGSGGASGAGGAGSGGAATAGSGGSGTGGSSAGVGGSSGSGGSAAGSGGAPAALENPWGIAPSASSTFSFASWAPKLAAAGISLVRNFDGSRTEASLQAAAANGMQVSGFFFYSASSPATFPVNALPAWRDYVTRRVNETRGRVHHWEVWNEPPNFSENKDPAAYGAIVASAYDAAKAADSSVQVGLAAQSNNLNFLEQAIRAGAADHFDYVTLHPYETLGLVDQGFEAAYMGIVPTLRKMLAATNPAKKDVPVWFTEVGEPVAGAVTPDHQADTLVKAYVMGIAQGVARVCWFEALDGDSGPFGLIDNNGNERPAYKALAKLVEHLGDTPRNIGWLLLDGKHYAFVFQGPMADVMVAWSAPGTTSTLTFDTQTLVVNLHTGASARVTSAALGNSPVLVAGVARSIVDAARSNAGRPFPWNGDFSAARSASYTAPADARGVHPLGAGQFVTIDGVSARNVASSAAQSFTVDPNFSSYTTEPIRITAVVRRNGADNAGFNLKYESKTGWKGSASWYTVPGSDRWYTQEWTINDAQFVGKWGYHFSFDSDSTQYSKYSIRSVTITKL